MSITFSHAVFAFWISLFSKSLNPPKVLGFAWLAQRECACRSQNLLIMMLDICMLCIKTETSKAEAG